MSFTTRDLWWITPIQAIVTVACAMNTGASGLQSPLTMPTLFLDKVPIQHTTAQLKYLLHESEKFFPPLNAFCTLGNIIVGVTAYLYKDSNAAASAKLPYAVAGAAFNIATTVFALTYMVPLNNRMKSGADALQTNSSDETAIKTVKQTIGTWKTGNLVRATMMLGASVAAVLGLLQDGSVIKIRSA